MSRGEFLRFCRQFAEGVYERVLASEPGATVLLDKTPNHLHEAAFILEVFPHARFIHIVRDPRAVVNSMLRAAEGWGSYWAPRSPIDAARRWLNAVLAYEELTTLPADVSNVRYEDLHADGPDVLLRLWRWLGLEAKVDAAREAHRACSIEQWTAEGETFLSTNERREVPDGFYREGRTDSWRNELRSHEVAVVEAICGEHMERFGYAETGTTAMARLRIETKGYMEQFHAIVGARTESLLGRL